MLLRPSLSFLLPAVLLAAACSDSGSAPPDAGALDATAPAADAAPDAAALDAAAPDAEEVDAGPPDTGRSYSESVLAAPWTELANAPKVARGKQDDVFFTTPLRGFAVSGPAESIYRTDDGGDSWTPVFTHAGTYFRSLMFTDDQHGFAGNLGVIPGSGITDATPLYATDDGGDTWNPVTAITGPAPSGICNQTKVDSDHLFAVGRVTGPSFYLSSSDSGATWDSIDLNAELQMLIDARFTSPTEGIVVGGTATNPMRCTILRTTDGHAFTPVFTSATDDTLCWKISFPSPLVGYVSIQNGGNGPATFAKTIDGGMTWNELPLAATAYGSIGIGFITDEIGWVSSDNPNQPTYRTTDGGATWTVDPVLKSPINRFRFVDERTAYAIGGSVYKMTIDWP